MNFDNIEYLKNGNRKQEAYSVLSENKILSKLRSYDPILVGTVPINIDIENSDLDIICCFENKQDFRETITAHFKNEKNFTITENGGLDPSAIVANFVMDHFEIEIFGQSIPTKQQFAYRHMIIENNLLNQFGEEFRRQIIELKGRNRNMDLAR